MQELPDSNWALIGFRYKAGDFISDFGYNAVIEDGIAKEIYKIGEQLYDLPNLLTADISISDEELKQKALDYLKSKDIVVDQTIEKNFDSKKRIPYYRIITEFQTPGKGFYCLEYDYYVE